MPRQKKVVQVQPELNVEQVVEKEEPSEPLEAKQYST